MENAVKISIIVPIYNVSKHLENCLESLQEQTLKDIEIICIDDGSTDDCREIIKRYAAKDMRIKPILLDGNKGTLVARKYGVLQSAGQYILFCDSDDTLIPTAAQVAWDEMNKSPVDILQFSTNVVYSNDYSVEERDALSNVLKPYLKSVHGDICELCFHEHKFGYTLWNKLYSGDLCKKAFSLIKDEYAIVSEDLYTFFVVSYFAQTYRGIKDKLYIYNFGAGITGNKYFGYKEFEKQCSALTILPLMETFLREQTTEKKYYTYYHAIKNSMIEGLVYQWRHNLSLSDADTGYALLLDKLGASTLISELAGKYGDDQIELLKRLPSKRGKRRVGKPVKHIGVYYHRMRNGGVEKVLSKLIAKWKAMGYEIVLFTDEEATEDDYSVPEDIERIVLPSFLTALGRKYKKRARYWETMIKKYNIDTIIYNSPTCHILLWDTCLLKGLGCNLIIETHCMFAGAMWYSPVFSSFLPLIYQMVDCVVSLSRVDVTFWQNYCPAYYIQNPIEVVPRDDMSALDSKNILWIGRFSEEKQPYAMLEAFEIVSKKVSEATLTIVGNGDSQSWTDGLKNKAKELNIYNKINFCGFQLDVKPYYQNAAIFAFTSMCEAAPVVLSESKSYGIPIVMFDLPNVEFARDIRGITKVPQKDIWAMANELIELLENDEKRKEMGAEARASIEDFARFDIEKAWKTLFYNVEHGMDSVSDEDVSIMLDLLFQNVLRGLDMVSAPTNNSYGDVCVRHEEVLVRHEEVVNRHEDVLNRHEEVVNRHEASINHQWEVQKWHEERLAALENKKSFWRKVTERIHRVK